MPNFSPSGIIHIGSVPFDNTYRHTMTFGSASEQQSYFASVCDRALDRSDYVYVRMNNSIRVPFNAEDLYGYNYVMYQNANYGNKWFYAFIVGCHYDNKSTTTLDLELDVMQTWYFDYTLTQGFVEREHVNDDAIGAHTIPEPEMPLQYASSYEALSGFTDRHVIVQTSQCPKSDVDWWENITNTITEPIQGDIYDGVWSGGAYLAFDMENPEERKELKAFFEIMNRCGSADAISAVFTYPSALVEDKIGDFYKVNASGTVTKKWYHPSMSRTSLGGYVPRNNKLFTYPYNYLMVIDNAGKMAKYRWERFEEWTPSDQTYSGVYFRCYCSLSPSATMVMIPTHYNGNDNSYPDSFSTQVTVPVSWVYSAYENWLAQNALTVATSSAATAFPFAIGATGSISSAVGYLGAGASSALLDQYGEDAVAAVSGDLAYRQTGGLSGLASGAIMSGLGTAGSIARMASVPDTIQGRTSDNTLVGSNLQTPYFFNMYPTREYCEMVDGFFDMFGYEVDSVKVPNRTGRPAWNYVKMRNSCHRGKVPAQDMARINSIYDAGITFWHTPDVGNYSLDNTL